MAVRTDLTIDFAVSPRIITIADPSTTITIQDLHDTLRTIEAEVFNIVFLSVVSSGGKEDLGGGVSVGITLTMQNAVLAFAARGGPTTIQCVVSGGNLVAVDAVSVAIDAIEPTAFTQVIIAQSSSATSIDAADILAIVRDNQGLILAG